MAIKEAEADGLIAFLNKLLLLDRAAVTALIQHRTPCNEDLATHATVQVGWSQDDGCQVGMLGLLNGFCGVFDEGPWKDWGPILAVFDNGVVERFIRTDRPEVSA